MNIQDNNLNNIQGAIVETIAFFDLFDFPMTDFEVWQNIKIKCGYQEIRDELNKNIKHLESKNGFWFLRDRSVIIEIRMRRYNYTDKKFKRALRVSKLFKLVPWIKMISIGNIIGVHNLKKEGDIDFFIITEKGRIWISRFFCVLIIKLLGLRPKQGNTKDKICLSFFIDEEGMNLKELMIKSGEVDYYFVYWLVGLVPIYNTEKIYEKLIQENIWIKEFLPNLGLRNVHYMRDVGSQNSKFYRDIIDILIGGFEKKFQKFSLKKLPQVIKEEIDRKEGVVINSHILKFHVNDRRRKFAQKYKYKLKELNING